MPLGLSAMLPSSIGFAADRSPERKLWPIGFLIAFVVICASTAAAQFPSRQFAVGGGARDVAVGDLDGDGAVDLVTANSGSDDVSVLLGNGDGTFEAAISFAVGDDPSSVAVGDLNGDAIPDLVTANFGSDDVSVLLGVGDGTFGLATTYAAGESPRSVVIADLDGDAIPDLAAANTLVDRVSVLPGNGDGTFRAATSFAVGDAPYSVAAGDLDGDAIPDLVTANFSGDDLSVLLGTGDGTFESAIALGAGDGPTDVAVADLDGDGIRDLVTSNDRSDDVGVLLGNGDGSFKAAVFFPARARPGGRPFSIAVADLDGDGTPDLTTANGSGDDVSVLLGHGDGTFGNAVTYAYSKGLWSVAIADLDGDRAPDLVTANAGDVTVVIGNGDGTFQSAVAFPAGELPVSVAVADMDGDTFLDLVSVDLTSDELSVLLGNGDGSFQQPIAFAVGDRPRFVAVGDLDGDGAADAATANSDSDDVSVLLGNGDGTFQSAGTILVGERPLSVTVADLDGDRVPDLATANAGGDVSVLLGNGDGSFQAAASFAAGDVPSSVAVGDLDGDAIPDLVTANSGGDDVSVLLGNGDGTFQSAFAIFVGEAPVSVTVADLDGDSALDLVTANYWSNDVSVLFGYGDGTFRPFVAFAAGHRPRSVAVVDFDRDDALDVVTSNSISYDASVLLGDGDGGLEPAITFSGGVSPGTVAVGDFNGDGFSDFVTANTNRVVTVFLNLANPIARPEVEIKLGGSGDGVLSPSSRGVVLVAIFGSEAFAVAEIDVSSVGFGIGRAPPANVGRRSTDLNGDGFPDLLLHFRIAEAEIAIGDAEVCLRGETFDGIPFEGCDAIRTAPIAPVPRAAGDVPIVPFVLLRLYPETLRIKYAYEFSQPYRKVLPPEGFEEIEDVLIDFTPPSDLGYTEIQSRLTGERILLATSLWRGRGDFLWPRNEMQVSGFSHGSPVSQPEIFSWWDVSRDDDFGESEALAAWDAVSDLDLVAEVARQGDFGVFAFEHWYGGFFGTGSFDWIVIVYGRPTAPRDVATQRLVWPRTVLTQNVSSVPEVEVHNFSDEALDVAVEVDFLSGDDVVYSSVRVIEAFESDTSEIVSFDPFTPRDLNPLVFRARLRGPGKSGWRDVFPDNDALAREIEVTELPVFRVVSSSETPGAIPLGGDMFDFDGDGDQDVIQRRLQPVFWQNDGSGQYTDTTSRVEASFHPHHRRALVRDFTGDGIPDVVMEYWKEHPILLRGDGTGAFLDITEEAGLTGYTNSIGLTALDLDGDADEDLILRGDGLEIVLVNDGVGHFSDRSQSSGLGTDLAQTEWIASGDLNADGLLDILMVNFDARPATYENLGSGRYMWFNFLGDELGNRMALFFDYDRDGDSDVLITRFSGDSLYRGRGNFYFADVTAEAGDLGASSFADVADIDLDGWTDLLLTQRERLSFAVNDAGRFVDHSEVLVEAGSSSMARFVDFDGDGDLDIYSGTVALENLGLPDGEALELEAEIDAGSERNAVHANPNK